MSTNFKRLFYTLVLNVVVSLMLAACNNAHIQHYEVKGNESTTSYVLDIEDDQDTFIQGARGAIYDRSGDGTITIDRCSYAPEDQVLINVVKKSSGDQVSTAVYALSVYGIQGADTCAIEPPSEAAAPPEMQTVKEQPAAADATTGQVLNSRRVSCTTLEITMTWKGLRPTTSPAGIYDAGAFSEESVVETFNVPLIVADDEGYEHQYPLQNDCGFE